MEVTDENDNWEYIKQRIALYVNGNLVSNETLLGGADGVKEGGLFRISWAPNLMEGDYIARFVFKTDSGDVFDYTWQFTIEN